MTRKPFRFKFGAITRLSLGLTALSLMLLMVGDFLFGLSANDSLIVKQIRKRVAENVTAQVIVMIEHDDEVLLGKTFSRVLAQDREMRSLAVRREDGSLSIERGDHPAHWRMPTPDRGEDAAFSSLEQVSVPIFANQVRWGRLEISFAPHSASAVASFWQKPMVMMIVLVGVGGFLLYYAYLRRAMHYLDPSAAIPERVHKAFDTLTDAIVVLDVERRILMANAAFRRLSGVGAPVKIGSRLGELAWLRSAAAGFGPVGPPWERVFREPEPVTDQRLIVELANQPQLDLSISSSLVRDENGEARGCLVSFTDQSELERTNTQLRQAIGEIEQSRARIKAQNEKLQHLAARDPLTGCYNRRAFFEHVAAPFASALRRNGDLCCIMTDIDHFKSFNDLYGHAIGDQVIRAVTSNIERHLRPSDLLCRYGGEEFCIVVMDATRDEAVLIAERIRESLEMYGQRSIRDVDVRQITASFGVSTITEGATSIEQLIDQADTALYASKENGRNRTTVFPLPKRPQESKDDRIPV
ncbi:MAG: diguanylate cyclase [Propionivibrio sp.]